MADRFSRALRKREPPRSCAFLRGGRAGGATRTCYPGNTPPWTAARFAETRRPGSMRRTGHAVSTGAPCAPCARTWPRQPFGTQGLQVERNELAMVPTAAVPTAVVPTAAGFDAAHRAPAPVADRHRWAADRTAKSRRWQRGGRDLVT